MSDAMEGVKSFYNKNKDIYEMEMRFGIFEKTFTPQVTLTQVTRVNAFFESHKQHYIKTSITEDITYYPDNIRHISNIIESVRYSYTQTKIKQLQVDFQDYNMRFCSSSEKNITQDMNIEKSIRNVVRRRTSYYSEKAGICFDIDEIDSKFTIEVESKGCNFDVFMKNVNFILQILQNSTCIISNSETNSALLQYYKISKKKKFIGVQPETISNSKILKNTNYAITEKLDGVRSLLYTFNENVYLLSPILTITKIPFKCSSNEKFILDGEYFNGNFYVFDIVSKSVLKNRLIEIDVIIKTIKPLSSFKISRKNYYFGNLYNTFKNTMSKLTSIHDGLIVVLCNTDYFSSSPLKWKPLDKLTIDFQIEFTSSLVELNVSNETNVQVFATGEIRNFIGYSNGDIVECKFLHESWIPIKLRDDKKKPNFKTIAFDNFNSIKIPFDVEALKDTCMVSKFNMSNTRRYFHWLKRTYIDKYSKNSVLDLGSGNGCDIIKYVDFSNKYIDTCVNTDREYNECTRIKNYFNIKNETKAVTIKVNKIDLNANIYKSTVKFDLITSFFTLGYLDTNMLISNIISNSKKNATIILMIINGAKEYDNNLFCTSIKDDKINILMKENNKAETQSIVNIQEIINEFKKYGLELSDNIPCSNEISTWSGIHESNKISEEEKLYIGLNSILVFNSI